jgi:NAD(P)-dependent dehydrogenase (short-subunit alcohol dehydrogenase family)
MAKGIYMAKVVISGASRGIGLALAREYAKAGDRVFAFCRSPQEAHALNRLAGASGGKISVHEMDVADGRSVAEGVKVLGSEPVDVLLNVAGILGGSNQGLHDSDFAAWHAAFEIMTIGPFRVVQALLPNLEKAKGKVVTITSQLAASTWPYGGLYAYGAAKAAVNRVMKSLSIDLRDKGVAVALVHPGYVKTDMSGPDADLTPEESAAGIHSVVSSLSDATTGSFLKWNGETHPW